MVLVCRFLILAALLGSMASTLRVYPHQLAYFNELAGGPENGSKHLLGSNVDWGQDLLFCRRWIVAHPTEEPVHLAYHGWFDPSDLGLANVQPFSPGGGVNFIAERPTDGFYFISENLLAGAKGQARDGSCCKHADLEPVLKVLRVSSPIQRIGGSMLLYRILGADRSHRVDD